MSVECLGLLSVSEYGVVVCKSLVSIWLISVFVVEALNEFPEACWVCAEIDAIECLFPACSLFKFDVSVNFRVEFLYASDSVRCGG